MIPLRDLSDVEHNATSEPSVKRATKAAHQNVVHIVSEQIDREYLGDEADMEIKRRPIV